MTNQGPETATHHCDSCGNPTATPPICEDCCAATIAAISSRVHRTGATGEGDVWWLLGEVDRLRSTIAQRGDQTDAERIQAETARGQLWDHWNRDRDRALQAELDRDRLAEQVQRVRDLHAIDRVPRAAGPNLPVCAECSTDTGGYVPCPCATLRVLNGGAT